MKKKDLILKRVLPCIAVIILLIIVIVYAIKQNDKEKQGIVQGTTPEQIAEAESQSDLDFTTRGEFEYLASTCFFRNNIDVGLYTPTTRLIKTQTDINNNTVELSEDDWEVEVVFARDETNFATYIYNYKTKTLLLEDTTHLVMSPIFTSIEEAIDYLNYDETIAYNMATTFNNYIKEPIKEVTFNVNTEWVDDVILTIKTTDNMSYDIVSTKDAFVYLIKESITNKVIYNYETTPVIAHQTYNNDETIVDNVEDIDNETVADEELLESEALVDDNTDTADENAEETEN